VSEVAYAEENRVPAAPGAGECYGRGLDIIKRNFLELLLVTVVVGLFWSIAAFAHSVSEKDYFFSPVYGLFYLGYMILIMNPVRFGGRYAYLRAAEGEKPQVKDIFVFQRMYLDVMLAAVLCSAIVVVGLVFLIVPGIIFACKLAFVPYLVIERRLDAVEAVKKSWAMTRGYAGTVFLIGLIAIPVAVIGLICLGVGVIFSSMWITSAITYLYYRVSRMEKTEAAQPAGSDSTA